MAPLSSRTGRGDLATPRRSLLLGALFFGVTVQSCIRIDVFHALGSSNGAFVQPPAVTSGIQATIGGADLERLIVRAAERSLTQRKKGFIVKSKPKVKSVQKVGKTYKGGTMERVFDAMSERDKEAWGEGNFMETSTGLVVTYTCYALMALGVLFELYLHLIWKPDAAIYNPLDYVQGGQALKTVLTQ
eukprot:TRINITY_DN100904_c0_g1_i1.p1 TRINITY_DN100904_c0_g1~~TRINITY_DN100904_c0_g1_i1.p1  ORF type:complete len:188 (+),score=18.85 TRINITY_DN100904_c0_g1_i1:63-626(+)